MLHSHRAALAVFGLVACSVSAVNPQAEPRQLILFVADGAGVGHWAIARLTMPHLAVDDFASLALVDTQGADHVITGSAASATAYAIGRRTQFSFLGVGPDSQPMPTVLDVAERRGMTTGLISTTVISDATPAAFASHLARRSALFAGRQFAASGVDVVMGGGRALFSMIARDSAPSILSSFTATHTYVTSAAALDAVRLTAHTKLLGLFADGDMDLAPDRSPSLARMTQVALDILGRNPNGFFLLVENEETDTQAHRNSPLEVIAAEMVALDEAIRVALAYQRRHPNTLIVVAADHETGGLSPGRDSTGAVHASYNTTDHTAELVPLFATGPGAEAFHGLMRNEQVGQLLLAYVGGGSLRNTTGSR